MTTKVLESKKLVVAEIAKKIKASDLVIVANYKKLTVAGDRELRKKLKNAKADYKVYKNSLTKLALKSLNITMDDKYFNGPTSFVFAMDPVAPSTVITKFAKDNPAIVIKAGLYQHKEISLNDIKELANMPSKQELLTKLVYLLQSPVTRFVNVVQGPLRKLVYALDAVQKQKK